MLDRSQLTNDLPWHFRYSRAENARGRRKALDLVQPPAGASDCLLSPARAEGIEVGGRGTRRPTADYGVSRVIIPLPALTRVE
jgi:hypothetical protein